MYRCMVNAEEVEQLAQTFLPDAFAHGNRHRRDPVKRRWKRQRRHH